MSIDKEIDYRALALERAPEVFARIYSNRWEFEIETERKFGESFCGFWFSEIEFVESLYAGLAKDLPFLAEQPDRNLLVQMLDEVKAKGDYRSEPVDGGVLIFKERVF